MSELNLEQRLKVIEENIFAIRKMLERMTGESAIVVPQVEEELMSVKQVADFLGLDATMIYSKINKNEIPFFKLGKQYRFKKADIMKWMTSLKGSEKFSVDDYVARYMQKNVLRG